MEDLLGGGDDPFAAGGGEGAAPAEAEPVADFGAPAAAAAEDASAAAAAASAGGSNGQSALVAWRREHEEHLDAKRKAKMEKQDVVRAEAKAALDKFYADLSAEKEKRAADNRAAEAKFIEERDSVLAGAGSDWQRAATLVDFKAAPVGRDSSRMREVMESMLE